jgi:hypothetical protein
LYPPTQAGSRSIAFDSSALVGTLADRVAEDIITALSRYDVADMHADPEQHPAVIGKILELFGDLTLDGDSASKAVDDARELGQDCVAGSIANYMFAAPNPATNTISSEFRVACLIPLIDIMLG